MYLKLVNGQPHNYSLEQLKAENPQTSFPEAPSDTLLAEFSVYSFTVDDPPAYDSLTQIVVAGDFVQGASGAWSLPWVVQNLPLEKASNNVRRRRDQILSDTDWVVIKATEQGQPVPEDWTTYRQALRDVSSQAGFPYSVVWPVKPE